MAHAQVPTEVKGRATQGGLDPINNQMHPVKKKTIMYKKKGGAGFDHSTPPQQIVIFTNMLNGECWEIFQKNNINIHLLVRSGGRMEEPSRRHYFF